MYNVTRNVDKCEKGLMIIIIIIILLILIVTDLIHVPIWNLLSEPIFLVLFYRLTFKTTATLPEITQAPNLFIKIPNKYSF